MLAFRPEYSCQLRTHLHTVFLTSNKGFVDNLREISVKIYDLAEQRIFPKKGDSPVIGGFEISGQPRSPAEIRALLMKIHAVRDIIDADEAGGAPVPELAKLEEMKREEVSRLSGAITDVFKAQDKEGFFGEGRVFLPESNQDQKTINSKKRAVLNKAMGAIDQYAEVASLFGNLGEPVKARLAQLKFASLLLADPQLTTQTLLRALKVLEPPMSEHPEVKSFVIGLYKLIFVSYFQEGRAFEAKALLEDKKDLLKPRILEDENLLNFYRKMFFKGEGQWELLKDILLLLLEKKEQAHVWLQAAMYKRQLPETGLEDLEPFFAQASEADPHSLLNPLLRLQLTPPQNQKDAVTRILGMVRKNAQTLKAKRKAIKAGARILGSNQLFVEALKLYREDSSPDMESKTLKWMLGWLERLIAEKKCDSRRYAIFKQEVGEQEKTIWADLIAHCIENERSALEERVFSGFRQQYPVFKSLFELPPSLSDKEDKEASVKIYHRILVNAMQLPDVEKRGQIRACFQKMMLFGHFQEFLNRTERQLVNSLQKGEILASGHVFGKEKWQEYFGLDVGYGPELSEKMCNALLSQSPFEPRGVRILDASRVVLVPCERDSGGAPTFNLSRIAELFSRKQKGYGGTFLTRNGFRKAVRFADFDQAKVGKVHWVVVSDKIYRGRATELLKQTVSERPFEKASFLQAALAAILMYVQEERSPLDEDTYAMCHGDETFVGDYRWLQALHVANASHLTQEEKSGAGVLPVWTDEPVSHLHTTGNRSAPKAEPVAPPTGRKNALADNKTFSDNSADTSFSSLASTEDAKRILGD